jgi:hypothetical protein
MGLLFGILIVFEQLSSRDRLATMLEQQLRLLQSVSTLRLLTQSATWSRFPIIYDNAPILYSCHIGCSATGTRKKRERSSDLEELTLANHIPSLLPPPRISSPFSSEDLQWTEEHSKRATYAQPVSSVKVSQPEKPTPGSYRAIEKHTVHL